MIFVFFVILVLFSLLVWRIQALSQNKRDGYRRRVLSQQTYMSSVIPYKRGDVKDRNLTTMATSVHVYDLMVDPRYLLDEENDEHEKAGLDIVRECFGAEAVAEVEGILSEKPDQQYVRVQSCMDMDTPTVEPFNAKVEELRKHDDKGKRLQLRGVWLEEKYARKYPMGTIACHVVGFSNSEDEGLWGVENTYNEWLNGTNGREYGYFDAELNLERTLRPAENGNTVVTTIDANVQRIVERQMDEWQKEVGSENMGVILANPSNGEIYAMAGYPTYDLNNPRDLTGFYKADEIEKMTEEETEEALNQIWRDFCISDTYEPGSTYKPFTVSAALEEGAVTEQSTFACDGAEVVGGYRIRCVNRNGHGTLTLSGTLEESCNDALMQMVKGLGRDNFHRYKSFFGFGKVTGIDLPGEAAGIIHSLENFNQVEMATSSFGQTENVTMIQMLAGFCSLINGGYYHEPHVVKQILNERGATVHERSSYLSKQTVSKTTSDFIRGALYEAVERGSAVGAKVPGYEICGKTGTAEKRAESGGTSEDNYLVSFLGFAPLEEPQLAIYVVIDQPHVDDQAHSGIATAFASGLLEEVLPFLEIYPTRKNEEAPVTDEGQPEPEGGTPVTDEGQPEPEGGDPAE